jgi:hypothetical protein
MKREFHSGAEARKKFEGGMSKLFRAPKPPAKETKSKPHKPRKD